MARRVEPDEQVIICHTDTRSPKVSQIRAHADVAWLFYDPADKVQLRLEGRATIHTDDALKEEQWAASNLSSRRCYLAPSAPSTVTEGPSPNLPEAFLDRVPDEPESEAGRDHFAVVRTRIRRMEVLHLAASGHRRAEFLWTDDGQSARWLEP